MTIPDFSTFEEMAAFWDTHDLTEFEDQLVEVTDPIFKNLSSRIITVMLDDEHYKILKSLAEQRQRNTTALVHEWLNTLLEEKHHGDMQKLNAS